MKSFRWPTQRHDDRTIEAIAEMYERGLTRGQIALKLRLTIGQVGGIIRRYGMEREDHGPEGRAEITRELTRQRLAEQYGPARAAVIIAGQDPATNADIAAWNTLGEKRGGRAA